MVTDKIKFLSREIAEFTKIFPTLPQAIKRKTCNNLEILSSLDKISKLLPLSS
jgi:hypothetical protein